MRNESREHSQSSDSRAYIYRGLHTASDFETSPDAKAIDPRLY